MSYHHCPIEPDDWANGPDHSEWDECPDCLDGRVNRDAFVLDGVAYPAIADEACETCDGTGFVEPADFDDFEGF